MNIGDLNIANLCVGSQQVLSACLGTDVVWSNTPPTPPAEPDYLTLHIVSAGTLSFKKDNKSAAPQAPTMELECSLNDGAWTPFTSSTAPQTWSLQAGDSIRFRGDNVAISSGSSQAYMSQNTFSGSTCGFWVEGNIMSLIVKDDFDSMSALTLPQQIGGIFRGCTGLTSAIKLKIPKVITPGGCENMFKDDINLMAISLDAEEVQTDGHSGTMGYNGGYISMLDNCRSISFIKNMGTTGVYDYTYNFNQGVLLKPHESQATASTDWSVVEYGKQYYLRLVVISQTYWSPVPYIFSGFTYGDSGYSVYLSEQGPVFQPDEQAYIDIALVDDPENPQETIRLNSLFPTGTIAYSGDIYPTGQTSLVAFNYVYNELRGLYEIIPVFN